MKNLVLLLRAGCLLAVALSANSCKQTAGVQPNTGKDSAIANTGGAKLKTDATVTYFIPVGVNIDHGDATLANQSLAWFMATYPGTATSEHVFTLTSAAVYNCKKRLYLPAYSRITEAAGTDAVLQADPSGFTEGAQKEFISLHQNSILLHVELRLNWMAAKGIFIANANNTQVIDVTVHKSRKIPSAEGQSYLIYVANSDNVNIDHCLLRRAGVDTEVGFSRIGWGIYLDHATNVDLTYNDVAVVPSAGIAFLGCSSITIDHNSIYDTGRAVTNGYLADGITSYHNPLPRPSNANILIHYNTINLSRNHGIHISGRGISIENNTITNSRWDNIYIGDQKTPDTECSANVWVSYNNLGTPTDGNYSIVQNPVQSGTIHFTGNTGFTAASTPVYCN